MTENTRQQQYGDDPPDSAKPTASLGLGGGLLDPLLRRDGEECRSLPENKASTASTATTATGASQTAAVVAVIWRKASIPLFLVLTALPFIVYRDDIPDLLRRTWFAPLMGIVACAIPSGGAPVAGGIVFLPVLVWNGIDARSAVAFSAATQSFGVGVFAPLGWLGRDPTVLLWGVIGRMLPFATAGVVVSLLLFPLESEDGVLIVFTIFILVLAAYVVRGLWNGTLDVSGELGDAEHVRSLTFTPGTFAAYAISAFLGGMVTGWIGICVEKLLFFLLTYFHGVDVVAAGITSIVVVGWASMVAFLLHALCAPDDDGPGPHLTCAARTPWNSQGFVEGNVPYDLLLMVLPGILLGSIVGPRLNRAIGPKNVMVLFVLFLLADCVSNILRVSTDIFD